MGRSMREQLEAAVVVWASDRPMCLARDWRQPRRAASNASLFAVDASGIDRPQAVVGFMDEGDARDRRASQRPRPQ